LVRVMPARNVLTLGRAMTGCVPTVRNDSTPVGMQSAKANRQAGTAASTFRVISPPNLLSCGSDVVSRLLLCSEKHTVLNRVRRVPVRARWAISGSAKFGADRCPIGRNAGTRERLDQTGRCDATDLASAARVLRSPMV
jgi:hypothetical protein